MKKIIYLLLAFSFFIPFGFVFADEDTSDYEAFEEYCRIIVDRCENSDFYPITMEDCLAGYDDVYLFIEQFDADINVLIDLAENSEDCEQLIDDITNYSLSLMEDYDYSDYTEYDDYGYAEESINTAPVCERFRDTFLERFPDLSEESLVIRWFSRCGRYFSVLSDAGINTNQITAIIDEDQSPFTAARNIILMLDMTDRLEMETGGSSTADSDYINDINKLCTYVLEICDNNEIPFLTVEECSLDFAESILPLLSGNEQEVINRLLDAASQSDSCEEMSIEFSEIFMEYIQY